MTELETMQRAKMYLDKLAQGIDPITDREVPEDSVLNNIRLARCFFYVSGVLDQVIANGGVINANPTLPFSAEAVQPARVQLSLEPVRVSQLTEMISSATANPRMKKLNPTVITDWLLLKGFLEKQTGPDGKSSRVPTQNGMRIGLSLQTRQGQFREYQSVVYNIDAQRFVLDNLGAMVDQR